VILTRLHDHLKRLARGYCSDSTQLSELAELTVAEYLPRVSRKRVLNQAETYLYVTPVCHA
jgi:hypothetical protein